jgi:hypothetical protein
LHYAVEKEQHFKNTKDPMNWNGELFIEKGSIKQ